MAVRSYGQYKCEACNEKWHVTQVGTQIGTHRPVFLCDDCIDDADLYDLLMLQELATPEQILDAFEEDDAPVDPLETVQQIMNARMIS